jgi:predicted HAD superfamily phosphohydrolase YqeG
VRQGLGRTTFERHAGLEDVLGRVAQLPARTVIFDVEPLVAHWDSGQDSLDRGISLVLSRMAVIPGLRVACFATNSRRRPSVLPPAGDVRVVYLTSAGKPVRTSPYSDFPQPGVVIGDQVATDGVLARRLGYTFLQYRPRLDGAPRGSRLMDYCGRLVRPLLFTRPG